MRTVRTRLVAVSAAAVLVLAGCGESPEPKPMPKPTKSASPSPSASATAQAPVMPAAAKKKTKAGAEAFARHYVNLINLAQATGDTRPLASAEDAGCTTCQQSRRAIRVVYASGASVRGGDWSIDAMEAIDNPASGGWLVELSVSFGPQLVDRPGKSQDQELKGGRLPVNVQMVWKANSWKVTECTRGA